MVLFIGDKPSLRTDPNEAFKGAACEKRLKEWINYLVTDPEYILINRTDLLFESYLTLAKGFNVPIVALGNTASKALKKNQHFKLPHPSFRNRKLNNKTYLKSILKECKQWLIQNSI